MIMMKTKYYKGILVLFIVFFGLIIFSRGVFAQDTNWALSINGGVPEFQQVFKTAKSCNVPWYGPAANINDGNTGTYVGGQACNYEPYVRGMCRYARIIYNAIVTFANQEDINKIEYVYYGNHSAQRVYNYSISTYLYYNNTWNLIGSRPGIIGGPTTISITSGAPWNNVSKVKIGVYFEVEECRSYPWFFVESKLYEIRAFGPTYPAYQDIGLRFYDGTGTISIAVEPTGTLTSPLRIAKNGVVYGVVLVDPIDASASKIRIKTSSGIKALRKF